MPIASLDSDDPVADSLRAWAEELGFTGLGVANIDLSADEAFFLDWLRAGFNGEMGYMSRHGSKRSRPAELVPGHGQLHQRAHGLLARGGRRRHGRAGRRQHRLRVALCRWAATITKCCARGCRSSAIASKRRWAHLAIGCSPIARRFWRRRLARNAGLGWIGKHTNLIDRNAGSYFFLGEIYLTSKLPVDAPSSAHCGSCSACMPACPTGAIVAPYRLDARRCISYLTIELARRDPNGISPRHRQSHLRLR